MDQLSPEIIHIVVSFMDLKERLQFRLVNKNFAFIGGAHILDEISMSIHSKHLVKMRGIAGQPLLARNVKSLIYESHCLQPYPRTFETYASEYEMWQRVQREIAPTPTFQRKPDFSADQLKESYQRYLDETKAQESSWFRHDDYRCLAEVMPSFCNLRKVTMSCGNHFTSHRRGKPTVYDDVAHIADYDHEPEGTRQLEALLDALGLHEMQIAELQAGMMDWRFFDKEPERLEQLFEPLSNLVSIDLALTVATDDEGALMDEAPKCRDLLKQGQVGDLFKSTPDLVNLCFVMQGDYAEFDPAASLDWVIPPGHVWPNLTSLELEGVDCSRAAIWKVLQLHKATLTSFAFGEIDLDGSWEKLLPDIRHKMRLREVLIYGRIAGHSEDVESRPEYWNLVTPDVGASDMRSSISRYCELGGENYPDELPLSNSIVQKYFDSHVRRPGMLSELEEAEKEDAENPFAVGGARGAAYLVRFGIEDEEEEDDEEVDEDDEDNEVHDEEDDEEDDEDDDPGWAVDDFWL